MKRFACRKVRRKYPTLYPRLPCDYSIRNKPFQQTSFPSIIDCLPSILTHTSIPRRLRRDRDSILFIDLERFLLESQRNNMNKRGLSLCNTRRTIVESMHIKMQHDHRIVLLRPGVVLVRMRPVDVAFQMEGKIRARKRR